MVVLQYFLLFEEASRRQICKDESTARSQVYMCAPQELVARQSASPSPPVRVAAAAPTATKRAAAVSPRLLKPLHPEPQAAPYVQWPQPSLSAMPTSYRAVCTEIEQAAFCSTMHLLAQHRSLSPQQHNHVGLNEGPPVNHVGCSEGSSVFQSLRATVLDPPPARVVEVCKSMQVVHEPAPVEVVQPTVCRRRHRRHTVALPRILVKSTAAPKAAPNELHQLNVAVDNEKIFRQYMKRLEKRVQSLVQSDQTRSATSSMLDAAPQKLMRQSSASSERSSHSSH